MKVNITTCIFSNNNTNKVSIHEKNNSNFITFLASKPDQEILPTSKTIGYVDGSDDVNDEELSKNYKELLREHVKLKRAQKKVIDSLEAEDKELSFLRAILEQNKFEFNKDKYDLSKKIETKLKRYNEMIVDFEAN